MCNSRHPTVARMQVHLFDIDIPGKITFRESETLTQGESFTIVDTPACRMGIGICYDLRFPELAMVYAQRGVQLIVYPGLLIDISAQMMLLPQSPATLLITTLVLAFYVDTSLCQYVILQPHALMHCTNLQGWICTRPGMQSLSSLVMPLHVRLLPSIATLLHRVSCNSRDLSFACRRFQYDDWSSSLGVAAES